MTLSCRIRVSDRLASVVYFQSCWNANVFTVHFLAFGAHHTTLRTLRIR